MYLLLSSLRVSERERESSPVLLSLSFIKQALESDWLLTTGLTVDSIELHKQPGACTAYANYSSVSAYSQRLTYLLAALLSSVVHDDGRVDEGAGGGHVLSQQAFDFVGAQTDRQIEELH